MKIFHFFEHSKFAILIWFCVFVIYCFNSCRNKEDSIINRIDPPAVLTPIISSISTSYLNCRVPYDIQFSAEVAGVYDNSKYLWEFGDGDTAIVPSPIHTYASPGRYNVSLKVTNSSRNFKVFNQFFVIENDTLSLTSDFSGSFISYKTYALFTTVLFYNQSKFAHKYYWNFGDSTYSESENPTHLFKSVGTYYVKLYAICGGGDTAVCSKTIQVLHPPKPTAVFTYTMINNNFFSPAKVEFVNKSSYASSFYWKFGDGQVSYSRNPTHVFTKSGKYEVKLASIHNNDTSFSSNTIEILPPPTKLILNRVVVSLSTQTDTIDDPDLGLELYCKFGTSSGGESIFLSGITKFPVTFYFPNDLERGTNTMNFGNSFTIDFYDADIKNSDDWLYRFDVPSRWFSDNYYQSQYKSTGTSPGVELFFSYE